MKNDRRTKDELIAELKSVGRKVKKLETILVKRGHTEENAADDSGAEEGVKDNEREDKSTHC